MNVIRRAYNRIRDSRVFAAARATVDQSPPPTGLHIFETSNADRPNAERVFKKITENDLYDMQTTRLIETLALSNGTAARLWDDFVMFGTLSYTLTSDSPRGQRLLDEFRETLETKQNTFDFNLRQIFSHIVLRGNYCFEVVLDENQRFSNFATPDPDLFRFVSRTDPNDGVVWELTQFDGDGDRFVIDSPFVHFEAINAMPGKRKGTALIAPAMPSIISNLLLMQDLRKVVSSHAFMEKFWSVNHIELKKAGYTYDQVINIVADSKKEIEKVASNRDKSQVPVVSGEMELKQYGGAGAEAGRGLGFVADVRQSNDDETMRGGMTTPPNLGIQNYQAESSMQGLGRRDALRIGSYQEDVEHAVSSKLTLGLRAQGVRQPARAELRLQRNNALILQTEAELFSELTKGIQQLRGAGIPTDIAIMMIETITDIPLPLGLADMLKAHMETEGMEKEGMDEPPEPE